MHLTHSSHTCIATIAATCLSISVAYADPVDCDGQLSDAQKEQRTFCTAFAPCAFVFSIFDKCVQAKSFFQQLGTVTQSEALTVRKVGAAVSSMAGEAAFEDPEAPSLYSCLPLNPDRPKCRQFLRLDPPAAVATSDPIRQSPEVERKKRMLALYQEEQQARLDIGGPWSVARIALASCLQARKLNTRDAICQDAQISADSCDVARNEWDRRKSALLKELAAANPGLGSEFTERISPLRGLGRQRNATEMWNDTVRSLKDMAMPVCPATLPDSYLTPSEALKHWAIEEGKSDDRLSQCDQLRRDTYESIDRDELIEASALVARFEAACSRERTTYANQARLARERIAAAREATLAAATPRRSTEFGASLFKGAIAQAEHEVRVPAARAARLREEEARHRADAQARAAYEAGNDSSAQFISALLTIAQSVVDVKAAQPSTRSAAAAQQLTQLQAQQRQENAQRGQNSSTLTYQTPVPAVPGAAVNRHYAPLSGCGSIGNSANSGWKHCVRNLCTQAVEIMYRSRTWGVGSVTVGVGGCYPVEALEAIIGVCEKNDHFDQARGQCRR